MLPTTPTPTPRPTTRAKGRARPVNPFTAEANGVRVGLITGAVLCAYTGTAALAGFLGNIEAGALDVVILALGSVYAIWRLKASRKALDYLPGFGTGIITALVASVMLGSFFWLLGGISKRVVEDMEARNLFGADLGILIAGLGIILLGTMTGMVTSLIAMQYFKGGEIDHGADRDI